MDTKVSERVFVPGVKEYLAKTLQTTVQDRYVDMYIVELNVQEDHVHVRLEIPPK